MSYRLETGEACHICVAYYAQCYQYLNTLWILNISLRTTSLNINSDLHICVFMKFASAIQFHAAKSVVCFVIKSYYISILPSTISILTSGPPKCVQLNQIKKLTLKVICLI